jgi:DNA recombination protein RmuC
METSLYSVVPFIVSFFAGAAIVWAVMAHAAGQSAASLRAAQDKLLEERGKCSALVAERDAARDQFKEERQAANAELRATLGAVAAETFQTSVVSPIAAEMTRVKDGIDALEKQRLAQTQAVQTAIDGLTNVNNVMTQAVADTKKEAAVLAGVLKDNRVRGKWGELTLERALELAGMCEHVSYIRQCSQGSGIPDVTVLLPGDRHVPVDAKAPLDAYYAAMHATDPAEQHRLFAQSAQALRTKVKEVHDRGYHLVDGACEYTILYVPIESVMGAALTVDPQLVEYALSKNVLIASPLTLMAQLKGFAMAWSWHKEQVNAEEIVEHAKTLVDRLLTVGDHLFATGKSLEKTVASFNKAVGSFDSRLVPAAQKVLALSGQDEDVEDRVPVQVESLARVPQRLTELPGERIALTGGVEPEAA